MRRRAVNLPVVGDVTPPGGGGTDKLEQRVMRLETDMTEVKADLKAIRSGVAALKGKVSMCPGYRGIAVIMVIVGGALLAMQRLVEMGVSSSWRPCPRVSGPCRCDA